LLAKPPATTSFKVATKESNLKLAMRPESPVSDLGLDMMQLVEQMPTGSDVGHLAAGRERLVGHIGGQLTLSASPSFPTSIAR
jgi:hypothetical protein